MTPLEEKKELLEKLKDSRDTIISGGVVKFGKGDTYYTFQKLEDINKMIEKTEIEIQLLENSSNIPNCGVCK